ncbi:MAG: hypothetical protein K2X34_08520, partial [Hyphomonadaceae bacterium]|nr:hypothetical protein [Hyphomonadaceae bacterium]
MNLRIAILACAFALAACDGQSPIAQGDGADAPQLDAPGGESEPTRVFGAANDGARAVAAELNVTIATRLPDNAEGDVQEILTLRGANGLLIEATVTGAISPATQVQGQTLRALLAIPVEEPQVLVYRVTGETKPEGGGGLCGADNAAYIVVWEPAGPGEPVMKLLGLT